MFFICVIYLFIYDIFSYSAIKDTVMSNSTIETI